MARFTRRFDTSSESVRLADPVPEASSVVATRSASDESAGAAVGAGAGKPDSAIRLVQTIDGINRVLPIDAGK